MKLPKFTFKSFLAGFTAVFSLFTTQISFAAGPALDIGDPHGGSVFSQNTYSLGWKFTADSAITVTALGFFDDNKDGLASDHEVGLYDATDCTLLRSTTVKKDDPLVGYFRYRKVSELTLAASKSYYMAAVTGSDKYLLSPTSLTVASGITFVGFSIFGNTESTTELKCPNGTHSPGLQGDFGPNFYTGTLPDEINNPGGGSDPDKRDTALTLFCNRNGVGLSNADCTATVADTGPPPRSLPTGSIVFEARDGFFPASAQCTPVQADFSPGIGKCSVQFSVPSGFGIGTKFPIDATYSGDTNFNSSSTSHKLIVPACVGTTDKPCPNSIGLTFSGYPQILKDKIAALVSCGSGKESTSQARGIIKRDTTDVGGTCTISAGLGLNIAELLKSLNFEDAKAIGNAIDPADASKDVLLQYLKQVDSVQNEERWKTIQQTQELLKQIQDDVVKNRQATPEQIRKKWEQFIQSARLPSERNSKKKKSSNALKTESQNLTIKADKEKRVNFKLPKRIKSLVAAMKDAGVATIPLEITLSAKQKNRKGTAKISEAVDVATGSF